MWRPKAAWTNMSQVNSNYCLNNFILRSGLCTHISFLCCLEMEQDRVENFGLRNIYFMKITNIRLWLRNVVSSLPGHLDRAILIIFISHSHLILPFICYTSPQTTVLPCLIAVASSSPSTSLSPADGLATPWGNSWWSVAVRTLSLSPGWTGSTSQPSALPSNSSLDLASGSLKSPSASVWPVW